MASPSVRIWADAPELAIPKDPALLSDGSDLWLAYETTQEPRGHIFAAIRFLDVFDHRLSPINDEGMGKHPYAAFGLQYYSFNEVLNSPEALSWRTVLGVRHWVITFKDHTVDILARSAEVVSRRLESRRPLDALLSVVKGSSADAGKAR